MRLDFNARPYVQFMNSVGITIEILIGRFDVIKEFQQILLN
jgi:hypothetical protein